ERVEVHIVRVRAPEAGRVGERDVAVPEETSGASSAHLVATTDAGRAVAAADDALDRHPIADVDAPALRRPVADPLDRAERLVAGNDGQPDGEHARILLGVAAADAARLDAEESAVVVDVGDRQLAELQVAGRGLDDRPARPGRHGATMKSRRLRAVESYGRSGT